MTTHTPASSSRRKFLVRGALVSAAALTTCSGLGALAARPPELDYPETVTYGDPNTMNNKILVTYATRSGSTAEVAQTIAKILSEQGAAVEMLPLKSVTDLKPYRAVVIGSGIRMSAWLPEAVKFVEKHQAALKAMPTAFFALHLMNLGSDETSRKTRLAYLDPVRKLVTPQKEALFAGVGDWKKVSFLDGLIGKAVKAPEGDLRDWQTIRAWADELCQSGFAGNAVQ